jgi:hypothetical protein
MAVTTQSSYEAALSALGAGVRSFGAVQAVEVRQTHASWVFLVEDRAFKLKKPLALGFLDYSTPARRLSACIEELSVNRELAPDIYLGVSSLVKRQMGFTITPGIVGHALDYLVVMRRFRDADTLAGLVASEELTAAHLEAVARRIAAFHRGAEVVAGGGPRQVIHMWRKNVGELSAAEPAQQRSLGLLDAFAEAFVGLHAPEIAQRSHAGLVRDGHGDLRCEHVLAQPTVRIVDRIEFDASLRHNDVGCDLAFLMMDLEALGRRDGAEELIRAYRGEGMDAGSDALLAFYAAHHALVRAKVALIAASDHSGGRADELRAQARSMVELGERLCWRARGPLAIVICGPAASGKSSLAAELSRRSGLPVLSSDATRKAAAGLAPTERADSAHYSLPFTRRTYELLADQAQLILDRGGGVILDASCSSRAVRSKLLERLAESGATRLIVRCDVPLEVALKRAEHRMRDPQRVSDASPEIVAAQHRSFEPFEEPAAACVVGLDATAALEVQIEEVVGAVDRRLANVDGAEAGPDSFLRPVDDRKTTQDHLEKGQ